MWQPLLSSIMKFAKMGLAPNRLKAPEGLKKKGCLVVGSYMAVSVREHPNIYKY